MSSHTATRQVKDKCVELKSTEGHVFVVSEHAACRSVTVKNMVEDTEVVDPIPIQVEASILRMVIEYLSYHACKEKECLVSQYEYPNEDTYAWDKRFVKVSDETLFELVIAANYLDIRSLLDTTCMAVADEMRGKTAQEIRTRFGIKNDFTPEEEAELMQDWW